MKAKPSRIALATLIVGMAYGQTLHAANECSNIYFFGTYGMYAAGNILVAPGFPASLLGPFARVGQVVADGDGNISVANTASYNGTIIKEAYTGTYTVAPDCSIDIQPIVGLPLGPGGALVPVPFEFVGAMGDNGNSASVVVCGLGPGVPCFPVPSANAGAAPTGNVIRVLLRRQGLFGPVCSASSLVGAYQLDMSGNDVSGTSPLPFARDGSVKFDGQGGFSGHDTVSDGGGPVVVENLAGTYAVDSHCNVSMNYSLSGNTHLWTGALTNQGNTAYLIVSEAGSVIVGTLTAEFQPAIEFGPSLAGVQAAP
jgi:hypothetical protein